MKLFDFFRKWIPTKNKKNYLRVYANWGKVSYSDIEKQNIIQLFSSILKKIYNPSSLKFDIDGPGYGISKGSPCFGQRAFDNKLKKFGYKKFGGMTIRSDIEYISSEFMFKDYDIVPRLEICFLWDNNSDLDLTKAIDLLTELSDLVNIEYAYSYPAKREMSTFEWITEKGFFSSGTTLPQSERFWSNNVEKIEEGKIKKIYPINCFNPYQLTQLTNIEPHERFVLKNKSEIWVFKSDLVELNRKAVNCILK